MKMVTINNGSFLTTRCYVCGSGKVNRFGIAGKGSAALSFKNLAAYIGALQALKLVVLFMGNTVVKLYIIFIDVFDQFNRVKITKPYFDAVWPALF